MNARSKKLPPFSPELRDLDIGVADAAERGEAGEPAPPRKWRGGVRGLGRAALPSQNRAMNNALALAGCLELGRNVFIQILHSIC